MFDKERIEKTLRGIDKEIREIEKKMADGYSTKHLEKKLTKLYEDRHTFKEMLNKKALNSLKLVN